MKNPNEDCPSNHRDERARHDFTVVVQWDHLVGLGLSGQEDARSASVVMCRWCRRIDKVLWQAPS